MSWAARFKLRQYVRQSLWVVPLLGTVAGALLAAVDLRLEGNVPLTNGWTYSASTAGSLLSAVAGAMIGLLGLVVTIGVLVVQMATGTLSPRFMRLWYRDRLQKLVLASFMATFAFTFALLRDVDSGGVPNLGVTLAGLAVTVDLILLLLYLDRFVHALRPVAVGAAMASAGLAVVAETHDGKPRGDVGGGSWPEGSDLQVRAPSTGAIQAIATRAMVDYAHDHGLVCVLRRPVGDFVIRGSPLIDVHGQAPVDAERRLGGMVALGQERTIDQDPAFAVRIIVDIAIRALSPAVNDPTTATQMINHLGALLTVVGASDLGREGRLVDRDGVLRLVVPTRTWESYLELGVSEIRQYGASAPQVSRRLRAMLHDLEAAVPPVNQEAVRFQVELLDRAVAQASPDEYDRHLGLDEDRQGLGGASVALAERRAPRGR